MKLKDRNGVELVAGDIIRDIADEKSEYSIVCIYAITFVLDSIRSGRSFSSLVPPNGILPTMEVVSADSSRESYFIPEGFTA